MGVLEEDNTLLPRGLDPRQLRLPIGCTRDQAVERPAFFRVGNEHAHLVTRRA
jgi:hypothetical protein